MKTYIVANKLKAKPMTRGMYNKVRGLLLPEDENGLDEGYILEYSDGTKQWVPKDKFEESSIEVGKDDLINGLDVDDLVSKLNK